jgi:hypothetical protein
MAAHLGDCENVRVASAAAVIDARRGNLTIKPNDQAERSS